MLRIRVLDIETTGLDPAKDAICEIGWADVAQSEPGTPWEVDGRWWSKLLDPARPIPPEVSAIHHIIDEDVAGGPSYDEVLDEVFPPGLTAVAAHQAKFERGFISDKDTGGLPWLCTYRCALRLWKDAPSHSNQALRYWRKPEGLDRNLALVAHRAGPDAYVTAHHLRDMLNGGALLEHLIKRSSQPALLVNCHIGKFSGKKWSEVDVGFLRWMLDKDFGEDEMFTARHWIDHHESAAAK